jgi:hypothetical protein
MPSFVIDMELHFYTTWANILALIHGKEEIVVYTKGTARRVDNIHISVNIEKYWIQELDEGQYSIREK